MLQRRLFLYLILVFALEIFIQPTHQQGLLPRVIRTEPIVLTCAECMIKNRMPSNAEYSDFQDETLDLQDEQIEDDEETGNDCTSICREKSTVESSGLPPNMGRPVAHMLQRAVESLNQGVLTLKPRDEEQDCHGYDYDNRFVQTDSSTPETEDRDTSMEMSSPMDVPSRCMPRVPLRNGFSPQVHLQTFHPFESSRNSQTSQKQKPVSENQLTFGACKCPVKTINSSDVEQDNLYAVRQEHSSQRPSTINHPQESSEGDQCPALSGVNPLSRIAASYRPSCDFKAVPVKKNTLQKQNFFDNDNEFDFSESFTKGCYDSCSSNKRRKGAICSSTCN